MRDGETKQSERKDWVKEEGRTKEGIRERSGPARRAGGGKSARTYPEHVRPCAHTQRNPQVRSIYRGLWTVAHAQTDGRTRTCIARGGVCEWSGWGTTRVVCVYTVAASR